MVYWLLGTKCTGFAFLLEILILFLIRFKIRFLHDLLGTAELFVLVCAEHNGNEVRHCSKVGLHSGARWGKSFVVNYGTQAPCRSHMEQQ